MKKNYQVQDLMNNEASLEIIGHHAFHASSLEYINIPNSFHTIGHDTFKWCQPLNKISLPSELTELQESTFQKCICLETVVIPSSVRTICGGGFSGCFKINLKINNLDFKVSDDCLY